MICRIGRVYQILFAAFFVVLVARSAQATSTGLNNIPTTDVVPENVLVFQTWGNFAGGEHPEQFVGFKYGLFKDMEFGVDWKANDQPHGHAMLQAKYAFDIEPARVWTLRLLGCTSDMRGSLTTSGFSGASTRQFPFSTGT
ncbi:MAG: hypothetical protein ACYSYT_06615 [Planctomycetota bacterium]|jgi:hypothetical protein